MSSVCLPTIGSRAKQTDVSSEDNSTPPASLSFSRHMIAARNILEPYTFDTLYAAYKVRGER